MIVNCFCLYDLENFLAFFFLSLFMFFKIRRLIDPIRAWMPQLGLLDRLGLSDVDRACSIHGCISFKYQATHELYPFKGIALVVWTMCQMER